MGPGQVWRRRRHRGVCDSLFAARGAGSTSVGGSFRVSDALNRFVMLCAAVMRPVSNLSRCRPVFDFIRAVPG